MMLEICFLAISSSSSITHMVFVSCDFSMLSPHNQQEKARALVLKRFFLLFMFFTSLFSPHLSSAIRDDDVNINEVSNG